MDRLRFYFNRLRERLWFRPLIMCLFSLVGVFLAKGVEYIPIPPGIPIVTMDSLETLLQTLAGTMLVVATFAVASMVSAYASAASTATPRSFPLVVADDTSQNALSIFIGAFIFGVVALTFLKNDFYLRDGRNILFVLTLLIFAVVIVTFVRWIDSVARLGRLGGTIEKVEESVRGSLKRRRLAPTLRCRAVTIEPGAGTSVPAGSIGCVQRIDVAALQAYAEAEKLRITVRALPGTFASPGRVLAEVTGDDGLHAPCDVEKVRAAFVVGNARTFDDDPRFGLVVLSEIAGRALSPAVNDPGTAIDIIGTLVRLFAGWAEPVKPEDLRACDFDRVEFPQLSIDDMFDDAFTAIARDGAASIEVAARLQKGLCALAGLGHAKMTEAANRHAKMAAARSEQAMTLEEDRATVRTLAAFAHHQ
ncbi:MAG: DUF2254 domain-containing protein [Phycisphaerales bacterium]|nr:DUF2254 domain-containing protein [Phycisphaerales bacterium]